MYNILFSLMPTKHRVLFYNKTGISYAIYGFILPLLRFKNIDYSIYDLVDDGKIMLFDKIRDAGKGAKEVIDYLGTTTGDFQMDIAETNDELRIKVESLVKMIKR